VASAPPAAAAVETPVAAPAPLTDSSHQDAPNPHAGMRAAAWALTVVGIVGIGGGGALFAVGDIQAGDLAKRAKAYNAGPTYPLAEYNSINQGRSQVELYDILMYVSGGVGVAALVTGIGLFVASSDTSAKTDVRVQLVPNPFGMSLVGNF
jgi:predicted anti-sigma-YlaC factor YlaD